MISRASSSLSTDSIATQKKRLAYLVNRSRGRVRRMMRRVAYLL